MRYTSLRRRLQNARRKNGRIKDKSVRNVPGPIKEEREIREGKAKNAEFNLQMQQNSD